MFRGLNDPTYGIKGCLYGHDGLPDEGVDDGVEEQVDEGLAAEMALIRDQIVTPVDAALSPVTDTRPVAAADPYRVGFSERRQLGFLTTEYARQGIRGGSVEPEVKEAPRPADVPSAADQLAAQFYSYHIGMEGVKESTKTHRVIMAGDGLYTAKRITVNGNVGAVITPTYKVPGLPLLGKGEIDIEIVNKVPASILRQLLSDFHAICKLQRTEAAAQVFKDADGNFEIYYPEQEVSGGTARYSNSQDNAVERWGSKELVLEVHSHNTMGAFFSGTDDANERRPGIYGVFGQLASASCAFVARFRYEKLEKRITLADVFDISNYEGDPLSTTTPLPEPSPVLIERAKRSNPAVPPAHFGEVGMYGRLGYRPGASALDDRYRLPSFGGFDSQKDYEEYIRMLREDGYDVQFNRDGSLITGRKKDKKKVSKATAASGKKAAKRKSAMSPMIDGLWVVANMTDPDQIRRMIIALDDKLDALAKEDKGDVKSE